MHLTEELAKILEYSFDEAMRTGSYDVLSDHVLLGIIRDRGNCICKALEQFDINPDVLKEQIDNIVFRHEKISYSRKDDIKPSREVQSTLNLAGLEAIKDGEQTVSLIHFMSAIMKCPTSRAAALLTDQGISGSMIKEKAADICSARTQSETSEKENTGTEKILTFFSTGTNNS